LFDILRFCFEHILKEHDSEIPRLRWTRAFGEKRGVYGFHRLLQILVANEEVHGHLRRTEGDHLHVDVSRRYGGETLRSNPFVPQQALSHDAHERNILDLFQSPVGLGAQELNRLIILINIFPGRFISSYQAS